MSMENAVESAVKHTQVMPHNTGSSQAIGSAKDNNYRNHFTSPPSPRVQGRGETVYDGKSTLWKVFFLRLSTF